MRAAVRLYAAEEGVFRALSDRLEVGVLQELERMPGFRLALAICCPGGVGMGILAFDTPAQLEAGMRLIQAWKSGHVADLLAETRRSELYLGEVLFKRPCRGLGTAGGASDTTAVIWTGAVPGQGVAVQA